MKLSRVAYSVAYFAVSLLLLLAGAVAWVVNGILDWKNSAGGAHEVRPLQPAKDRYQRALSKSRISNGTGRAA